MRSIERIQFLHWNYWKPGMVIASKTGTSRIVIVQKGLGEKASWTWFRYQEETAEQTRPHPYPFHRDHLKPDDPAEWRPLALLDLGIRLEDLKTGQEVVYASSRWHNRVGTDRLEGTVFKLVEHCTDKSHKSRNPDGRHFCQVDGIYYCSRYPADILFPFGMGIQTYTSVNPYRSMIEAHVLGG